MAGIKKSTKRTKRVSIKEREAPESILRNYVVHAMGYVEANNIGNITVIINGQHHHINNKTGEEIAAIEAAVALLERTDGEAEFNVLMGLLKPISMELTRTDQVRTIDGDIYLGNIPVPVPQKLGEYVTNHISKGYPVTALERFWALLLLNPDKVAREHLFDYCLKFGVTITSNGHMLLYKAVTTKKKGVKDKDLRDTVSTRYLAVKKQKRNPSRYVVYQLPDQTLKVHQSLAVDGTLKLPAGKDFEEGNYSKLGTLDSLYSSMSYLHTDTVYTDKWTKTMDIMLGVPVKEPREVCDSNPSNKCARGLHFGSYKYIYQYANSGDDILLVIVNPMNVVAIPLGEAKIRGCEYYPTNVVERDSDGHWTELESPYYEEDYLDYQKDSLINKINEVKGTLINEMAQKHQTATIPDSDDIFETTLIDLSGRDKRRGEKKVVKKKRTQTTRKTTKPRGKGSRKKATS